MSTNQLERIRLKPSPLINLEHKYVIIWSAKVGCTFILKWFYKQNDLLKERSELKLSWHYHRVHHYYKSEQYLQASEEYTKNHKSFTHIKFTRNPFERAASSYLHILKKADENHPMAQDFLNMSNITSGFKMSFREFVAILETKQIRKCNIHWRSQTHHIERVNSVKIDKYIDIKDSINEIPKLEKKLGLIKSSKQSLLNLKNNSHHHTTLAKPESKKSTTSKLRFIGDTLFNKDITLNCPPYQSFYDQQLEKIIYRIYREDFKNYKYSPTYIS